MAEQISCAPPGAGLQVGLSGGWGSIPEFGKTPFSSGLMAATWRSARRQGLQAAAE